MATKVSITFIDHQNKEEVIKKTFFGSEHMNRWITEQEKEVKNIEYIY